MNRAREIFLLGNCKTNSFLHMQLKTTSLFKSLPKGKLEVNPFHVHEIHSPLCLRPLLLLLSHFSRVQLLRPHRRQPTRLPCPWDSPGKNTGVGCHFLLQCMKVKSESEVPQPCPTLHDPMDHSLLGCCVHGISQARVLEWGAIAFSADIPNWSHYFFLLNTNVA